VTAPQPGPVVDTHGHLLVPAVAPLVADHPAEAADAAAERASFSAASVAANTDQIKRVWPQLTDVGRRLADLDAMGVDIQVVGPMPMHRYWAEPDLAVRLATVTNEAVAAHCADGQGRLVGLGTIPLQHPDLAVRVLQRATGELGLLGISVSTNVDGRELADRAFDPVWEAAADLGAVVFIHPWGCSLGPRLASNYLGNTFGQPAETALALSRLIFDGTLDRHPGLKLLAAHGGGFLPVYIGRSDHAWGEPPRRPGLRPPSERVPPQDLVRRPRLYPWGAPPPRGSGRRGQGCAWYRLPVRHGGHRPGSARHGSGPARRRPHRHPGR
jgi:aminocarboxymuconate-semialdehyde decarboxylase